MLGSGKFLFIAGPEAYEKEQQHSRRVKDVKIGPVRDLRLMVVALGCFENAGQRSLADGRKCISL
jgi:hypothetical protein